MDKARSKCRDMCFRSEKNQKVACVHSAMTREYARVLEQDPEVVSYEACYGLDMERYQYVDPVDIRKDYFSVEWMTNFVVSFSDGRMGILKLIGSKLDFVEI